MLLDSWLSWRKNGSLSQKRTRRRRNPVLLGGIRDWLLEDRCLLNGTPFPVINSQLPPTAANINTVNLLFGSLTDKTMSSVFSAYAAVPAPYNNETVTITNNAPIGGPTIYPFFLDANSNVAIGGPNYSGTSEYDPYDPLNQGYRGYIGYQVGSGSTATYYAGLAPGASITVTVPLVFWNAAHLDFTTDGTDLFSSYSGTAGKGFNGAPFYFQSTNTQASYYSIIDPNDSTHTTLDFVPAYNSFVSGQPSTNNWQAPVNTTTNPNGFLKTGVTYNVSGPGGYTATATVSSNAGAPGGYVMKLSAPYAGTTAQSFTFTVQTPSNQNTTATARYLQTGFSLTTQGTTSQNGVVMWYHALLAQNPNNDAPFQLTEITIRSAYYASTGTNFAALMGGTNSSVYIDAIKPAADYDVSYVDSINMPVAMEATNVAINNTTSTAPFGWVGSSQSLAAFESALVAFASTNKNGTNTNFLGTYFGSNGWPNYLNLSPSSPGYLKLPSGQNLYLASPLSQGGAADIQYYDSSSSLTGPQNTLTSGVPGPTKLSIGGSNQNGTSSGSNLYLSTNTASDVAALNLINTNLQQKVSYNVYYNAGTTLLGQVGSVLFKNGQPIGIQLANGVQVPANAASQVYDFKPVQTDYAGAGIASLWYSWAQYYALTAKSTAQTLSGTLSGNVLTLTQNPTGLGLAPGMTVTVANQSGTLPSYCVILAISGKTITLSTTALTGNPNSFSFSPPALSAIAGSTKNGLTLVTPSFQTAFGNTPSPTSTPYLFAQTVYTTMAAWSAKQVVKSFLTRDLLTNSLVI